MKENDIPFTGFVEPENRFYYALDSVMNDPEHSVSYLAEQMERVHADPALADYLDYVTKMYMQMNKRINGFLTGFYEMRFALDVKGQLIRPTLETSLTPLKNQKKHSSLIDPYNYSGKYPNTMNWVKKETNGYRLNPKGEGRMNMFVINLNQFNASQRKKHFWNGK